MNRTPGFAAALILSLAASLALSGCSTSVEAPQSALGAEASSTRPADLLAPCNLGEEWDNVALLKVARYDAPAVDDSLLAEYGPTVANGSCADAEIIKWQELRRETGESDQICRITWYDDYFSAVTYPIGCAVPVLVVTDASR